MKIQVLTAVAVAAFAGAAHAGTFTSYFGEDLNFGGGSSITPTLANTRAAQSSFLDRLVGNSVEGFESFSTGNVGAGGLNLNFSGSAGNLSAGLTGSNLRINSGNDNLGRFPTEGQKYLRAVVSGGETGSFTIEFAQPTAAFGFVATDLGDFGASISIELSNGSTNVINIPATVGSGGSNSGSAFFFGVVGEDNSSTFTRIRFLFTNPSSGTDVFGFDEMTIGDRDQIVPPGPTPVIPLPSAAGLGFIGLGLLAARRRRD